MDEGNSVSERLNRLDAHVTVFEEDIREGINTSDDATDCIRYGPMEIGGFVRETTLTSSQRTHMYTQQRVNFVLWRQKQNMADTTDTLQEDAPEGGGEESPSEEDPVTPDTGIQNLVERMKLHLNTALAQELWYEASQMQQAVIILLDASSGNEPAGLTMEVMQNLRGVFQRLYRYSRNRGGGVMIDIYRQYIDDMHSLMQPA